MNMQPEQSLNDGTFWGALFSPDSIAVIGANETLGSWGSDAIKAAIAASMAEPRRRAYAVNPNQKEILGRLSYQTITSIPDKVDLAIVVVRSSLVPDVMRQCVQKGVKAAVIISAGFADTACNRVRLSSFRRLRPTCGIAHPLALCTTAA